MQDGGDVQRQPQQDNGEFQYLLGGELQPCGEHIRLANELVKKHANEHGNYRRANQVDGQQALKPASQQASSATMIGSTIPGSSFMIFMVNLLFA